MIKNNKVTKYTGLGILTAAIILGASQHTNNSNSKGKNSRGNVPEANVTIVTSSANDYNESGSFIPDGYYLEGTTIKKDVTIAAPVGFHLEEGSKIVKNPEDLVDASFISEEGYHLEQYDYDNNLFYVIKDGYHNEHGYLIPDGYHLEGSAVVRDITIAVPTGFHLEGGSKIVKNPENLVDASFIPEEGYHLEQYDYDNNLFYVIKDGYHNEHGYLVLDGYHLEGTTIIKDTHESSFSKKLKLK